MKKYQPSQIEAKWQQKWASDNLYATELSGDKKCYVLVEFAYPSGDLHMGHWFTWTPADIYARYKRMQGYSVFFPNGFDAFGLPAENAAIKHGTHPRDWTLSNIKSMKRQYEMLGASFSFDHEVITCNLDYYQWNQWIFLKMLERGLAYKGKAISNWCPSCQTVLANEGVEAGKCWRCGSEVVQKEVEQWFLKITDYADRLIWPENPSVDWPKSVREGQNNWIGRSQGLEIDFPIANNSHSGKPAHLEDPVRAESSLNLTVYTVFPETIYGVTYLVIAPEHPLVGSLTTPEQASEVKDYITKAGHKSEIERKALEKDKTGVFTGSYVTNPVNDTKVPVWVADYVIGSYGTGVVMGVPGSDHRDFAFAKKYQLPVIQVISPDNQHSRSYLMGADQISDQDLIYVGVKITSTKENVRLLEIPNQSLPKYEQLIEQKLTPGFWNEYVGRETVFLFKFKDGTFKHLPLTPETDQEVDKLAAEFNEETQSQSSSWFMVEDVDFYRNLVVLEEGILINSDQFDGQKTPGEGKQAIIDYLIKQGWAREKIQYHLHDWSIGRQRYWGTPIPVINCPKCGVVPVPSKDLPVELPYEVDFTPKGKPPLATDEAWLKVKCPNCGGEAEREAETMDTFVDSSWYFFRYLDPKLDSGPFEAKLASKMLPVDIYFGGAEHTLGHTLYARFLTKFFHDLGMTDLEEFASKRVGHGIVLGPDGNKMSKSRGNVVNPDEEVHKFGADTVRVYLAFFMPYESVGPWIPERVNGSYRFLQRVWGLQEKVTTEASIPDEDHRQINLTIKKVSGDIQAIKFNTAVAALMEWLNYLSRKSSVSRTEYLTFLKLLAPFAPHITEELWHEMGETKSIHLESWPQPNPAYLKQDQVTIGVQINGRLRDSIKISPDASQEEATQAALESPKIRKFTNGSDIKKTIYVPAKILSMVV